MSVILTACRHSRQKAIEKAIKKKAEKKREKREAAMNSLSERLGVDSLEGENNVKIWTFLLNGEPTSVVLHRDTLEVACNGEVVDSSSDFWDCGATIDFRLGTRRAQITSSTGSNPKEGIIFTLTVEGSLVPDPPAMSSEDASAMMGPSSSYNSAPGEYLPRYRTDMEDAI